MQLVVLKSENRTHIGKSFSGFKDHGQVNIPSRFFAYPSEAQNIDEFSQLALEMEANHPDATLILGQLTEQAQNKAINGELIYRRSEYIEDREMNLILLDIEYDLSLIHI